MIGGKDIYVDIPAGAPAMDFAVRAIRHFWPDAVFENANDQQSAGDYCTLDFSNLSEVMAYKNMSAAKEWDDLGADPSLDGTMVHLLVSATNLAIIVDNHPTAEIEAIVQTITQGLKRGKGRINWREAA